MTNHAGDPPQPTHLLRQFDVLVGEWDMVGTHPFFDAPVKGHSIFEWLVDGMLLTWHFNWNASLPPNALSVIGHDDTQETCSMLYSDVRGVSRIYQMSLEDGVWKIWRESSDFSQRMIGQISDDQNSIVVRGDLSRDGSVWDHDLSITYTRKK